MAGSGFIIVLDRNLDDPQPWQASRFAETLEALRAFRTHDCSCTHVRRQSEDREIGSTTLFGSCTQTNDPGRIIALA